MTPTANDYVRLRDLLLPGLGDEATMRLMEFIPTVPPDQLATKADLKELEAKLVKWIAGSMITGMTMSAGISAAIASAIAS